MGGGGQPLGGDPAANELSGVVHGSAVQARSIEGGVHFTVTPPESARMPLPAQLPVAAAHFTGRAQELAALQHAAEEYDPVRRLAMVVISGPGGAGKSSLATQLAVTTRWRIAGLAMDGARFIELGPLDDESGAALLSRMIGADRAAAEAEAIRSVVRLCGGLPLAGHPSRGGAGQRAGPTGRVHH